MPASGELNWERVDSFVDRQINAEQFHIWPFANTYPIDVRFLILDRRHDVPRHRPDHLEVVVFESGELGYEVEDRTCVLRKNDILVVSDRIRHRCLPLGISQREARAVVLSFLPRLFHSGTPAGDDAQYLMPFTLQDASFPNVIPAGTRLWREIFDFIERIRCELPAQSARSRLAINTYLKMILLAVVNHYSSEVEVRQRLRLRQENASRLASVLEHIERRYDEPIRVNEAARLCAMSASCFLHLFKQVTGQSFVAYLNRFRVARAQGLLVSTNKTIAEISLETGFCNQSYFGAVFRRAIGTTPLAYRLSRGAVVSSGTV